MRDLLFDALNGYRTVSSGGAYRNNVGGPVEDKLAFLSGTKFCLAVENASHPGYVTEKIVDAFAAGTVPIYWGDPSVCDWFNPSAFVNVSDFATLDGLVSEVRRLDTDSAAYLAMLSAPVFHPGFDPATLYDDLRGFLFRIFEQLSAALPSSGSPATVSESSASGIADLHLWPGESARRISRDYWSLRYLVRARRYAKAYSLTPCGLLDTLYHKTLWRFRHRSRLLFSLDRLLKR